MKYLFATLLVFTGLSSFAQHKRDTIYMDEDREVTKMIDSAKYYRLIKEADGLYQVRDYFIKTDTLLMTGAYKDYAQTKKEGEFVYYSEKGLATFRKNYKNGLLNGTYSSYYDSGELHYTDSYVDGYNHGDFLVYYRNGALKRKETWAYGKMKSKACFLENGKKTTYFPYWVLAEPPGGMKGVKEYLKDNLEYPEEAENKNIQGKVLIEFVISKTGEITNVQVKKSSSYQILDDEAVRVVKSLPKWKPGKTDGEFVESIFDLPVSFKLQGK